MPSLVWWSNGNPEPVLLAISYLITESFNPPVLKAIAGVYKAKNSC